MASFDQKELEELEELEDSFEIEFGQLPGAVYHSASNLWWGRPFDARHPAGVRRRRISRVAVLVALVCLVLINSLNLSGLLPAALPFVSSNNNSTARAAGASWFSLKQRPLHLPTLTQGESCPVTPVKKVHNQLQTLTGMGNATIFVSSSDVDADGVQRPQRGEFARLASTYQGVLAIWYLWMPDVQPVLIRGAQLDGSSILRFDGGIEQPKFAGSLLAGSALPQLLIASSPSHDAPVTIWTTITRVENSGCYAYQIDTASGSMVLVFRAIVAK